MHINLKVFRFDPETEKAPHYDTFELEAEPTDRVLDLLEKVRGEHDGTLAFRRSCAHGVCGSDAMRINGKNALACKVLVRDLNSDHITIEPLLGLQGDQRPDRGYGALLRALQVGIALPDQRRAAARRRQRAPAKPEEQVLRYRGHHQVHPVRRLHHLLPVLLGRRQVRWPGGHRQRAPLHL